MAQRSSTRLHHAPGGQSSMGSLIFGGGDDAVDEDRPRRGVRMQQQQPQVQPEQKQQSEQESVSSNRYANGASQNSGNVITDRSSTRIHAPPGGQTTTNGSDQRGSSNRYASRASQNTGNVITDRSTTRIHAPPGGASSFKLG